MDQSAKEEFEENVKILLNRVVANIDYVEEVSVLERKRKKEREEGRPPIYEG